MQGSLLLLVLGLSCIAQNPDHEQLCLERIAREEVYFEHEELARLWFGFAHVALKNRWSLLTISASASLVHPSSRTCLTLHLPELFILRLTDLRTRRYGEQFDHDFVESTNNL